MKKIEQTKLKISILSNEAANRTIEELLYKNIAKILFNKPDFKESLLLQEKIS